MARIVGGVGVPHTPYFPKLAADEGPEGEINTLFAAIRADLEAMRPDAVVIIDTDHFSTFFFDNYPTFAIGIDDAFYGPVDDVALLPPRDIRSDRALAASMHETAVHMGFDSAHVTHFKVGHSCVVPLHFLIPAFAIPVVPVFLNGHMPPMPSAGRALAFGKALRAGIEADARDLGVAVIGTGSFSLDVAGPQMYPGENFGVPDLPWAEHVQTLLETGAVDRLIAEATEERMLKAGNVGGELLNWIAMIGAVGNGKARWMKSQPWRGHAYGVFPVGDQR